jgi:hypothetical protein
MPISYPYKMSDWYGYDKDCSSLTQFPLSLVSNFSNVCSLPKDQVKYHTGSSARPVSGDIVWDNANGTGVPSNGYYKVTDSTTIQISSGVSSSEFSCIE